MDHFGKTLYNALKRNSPGQYESLPHGNQVSFETIHFELHDLIKSSRYLDQSIFDSSCFVYKGENCIIYSFGPLPRHIWQFATKAIDLLDHLFSNIGHAIVKIALAYSKSKKQLPKTGYLQPQHINSGVSMMRGMCCVIYRQEEMQKVILHELMHLWGVDAQRNEQLDAKIEKHFKITSMYTTIRLGETYNDVLCCIILSAIRAFKKDQSQDSFDIQFKKQLDRTRRHVLSKAANMIQFYDGRPWVEATHAFAYYVGKAIVFDNLHAFDMWLNTQEGNGANANFYEFLVPILKKYSSIKHIQDHFKVHQTADKSIRMMPSKTGS